MNELLARAGSLFLAPATPAAPTASVAPPVADLVVVLAAPRDLAAVAGAVAAGLRRPCGARTAVVCRPGEPWPACPAGMAATALARRLAARDIAATAAGSLCRVALAEDPEASVPEAWRLTAAAAGSPVVVALAGRHPGFDGLLAQADRLLLATATGDDPDCTALALASLAALGPPAALVTAPSGPMARRAAALGLLGLGPPAHTGEVPA